MGTTPRRAKHNQVGRIVPCKKRITNTCAAGIEETPGGRILVDHCILPPGATRGEDHHRHRDIAVELDVGAG